ncbi:hypothetical protein J7L68_03580 [bacterium]|nr:hypothetical protein [bacterium]
MDSQIKFDYSAAKSVIDYFQNLDAENIAEILDHPAYELVFEHSSRFSSTPFDKDILRQSLNGKSTTFNFDYINSRLPQLKEIVDYLENNEQKMLKEFAPLALLYLPDDYESEVTVYFVIGGYNGVVLNDRIAINIDWAQFRNDPQEILLYLPHELFHIGFSHYQKVLDIFTIDTENDLKKLVMSYTMNEGLATLVPYKKRLELNALSDYDYSILTDEHSLSKKIKQFELLMNIFEKDNQNNPVTDKLLENILGQCSADRLFYIVGCYMGLQIEQKYGRRKLIELIEHFSHDEFFNIFENVNERYKISEMNM